MQMLFRNDNGSPDENVNTVPCHSFVLEARGFNWNKNESIFGKEEGLEGGSRVVDMSDTSNEIGSTMLRWMYTGKLGRY